MTTEDILKANLSSLKLPDPYFEELARQIDDNTNVERFSEGYEQGMEHAFLENSKINLERGCKVMTFDEFKSATKSLQPDAQQSEDYRKITKNIGGLSEEADAQQRYEKAVKHLTENANSIYMKMSARALEIDNALQIAAGLKN